jgi:serine/threonine-protein kinase
MAGRVIGGPLLTGVVLGDRYELGEQIGRGGMAEVYEAMDRVLSRRVAVKVLRDGMHEDQRVLSRFRREARAAAALSHPNIVAVHDVGFEGGTPYLVMELVAGRSLAEVIRYEAPLAEARAAAIAEQIAAALAFAHARGIVHRDVTPGNVIVMPGGVVKVLDFGISRATMWTPVTPSPTPHGTAAYVAPEQASGAEADPRSDVYSLGVVLFEMLTGRPPFTGEGATALTWQHVHQAPMAPRTLVPSIGLPIEGIVMRCLAKDPDHRYRRAEDLKAELAWVRGSPHAASDVAAAPPSPPQVLPPAPTLESVTRPSWTAPVTIERRSTRKGKGEPPRSRTGRRVVSTLVTIVVLASAALVGMELLRDPPARSKPGPEQDVDLPPPLYAPTGVVALEACDGWFSYRIDLTWSPTASTFADGYEVMRADYREGPYEMIAVIDGRGSTYFSDVGLGGDNMYFYKIKSFAAGRHGPPSEIASAITPFFCL